MASTQHAEMLIAQLAKILGLEELSLDEAGCCTLAFDEKIFVEIENDTQTDEMTLRTRLGVPRTKDLGQFYARLLESNYFFKETSGIVLALDGLTGEVVQIRTFPPSQLDFEGFQRALEQFVNRAEAWRELIESDDAAIQDDSEATMPESVGIRV